MPLKVEFQFDFGSPNAYLAEVAIPGIEQRTGVKFEYVPVLLGGIYKATGNMSPFDSLRGIKNKPEYQALETQRFIRRHDITKFRQNSFFPVNTLMLMRGAVAAQFEGVFQPYFRAAYHHMWEEPKKMDDLEIFRRAFTSSGIDIDRLLARAQQDDVKKRLIDLTNDAVSRGAFGSPTFFVGKGDVLRQGPDPRRRGVDRRTDQATPSQDRLAAPAVRLRRKPSTRTKNQK
ncbi:2-hydroxychromene-2-carboxylate isomerase [Bradyrhizobium sp. LM2.9]